MNALPYFILVLGIASSAMLGWTLFYKGGWKRLKWYMRVGTILAQMVLVYSALILAFDLPPEPIVVLVVLVIPFVVLTMIRTWRDQLELNREMDAVKQMMVETGGHWDSSKLPPDQQERIQANWARHVLRTRREPGE